MGGLILISQILGRPIVVHHKQIQVPVIIKIPRRRSPARSHGLHGLAGLIGYVGKCPVAVIAEYLVPLAHRGLGVVKIRHGVTVIDKDIQVTVVIHVHKLGRPSEITHARVFPKAGIDGRVGKPLFPAGIIPSLMDKKVLVKDVRLALGTGKEDVHIPVVVIVAGACPHPA